MHPAITPYLADVALTGSTRDDMVALLRHNDHPDTSAHCLRVGAQAKRIAQRFAEDEGKAEVAGWLHDISAIVPNDQRISLAEALGLDVLAEERRLPMIVHQKLSAVIAHDAFSITDAAILSAIGCHTTLKAGASRLDIVVFVADKIAWDQPGEPPYLAEIMDALDQSLDAGALCYIEWLWAKRDTLPVVHPWLVAGRDALLRR